MLYLFFFQAEDGIRDHCVTGVQTCALPISSPVGQEIFSAITVRVSKRPSPFLSSSRTMRQIGKRRVGKECRSRWSPYHLKNKNMTSEVKTDRVDSESRN